MTPIKVNADNFGRAETHRMMAGLQRDAGGVNLFSHNREPTPVDKQTVIRMNRDTLYSFAVVDITQGATLTVPTSGERYLSVMVVNEDHYVNRVFHDSGRYELTVEEFDSPYVVVAARVLVDPTDPDDLAAVSAVQDGFALEASSGRSFEMPDYDTDSLDRTRDALLGLAADLSSFTAMFGRREDVDPVHHLIGTAAGWGGLPEAEATYVGVFPNLPVDEYDLTVDGVPVDGFWSISVYNADGFFEPNDQGRYSVNNVTATPNDDGSVTVRFGGEGPNALPIVDGWNYIVRLYRPQPEILSGDWTFPSLAP